MNRDTFKIVFGYILMCVIWSSTWLVIKLSLDSLTPLMAAGSRFSLAAVFIFLFIKFKKIKLQMDALSIKLYFVMGFLSFVIPFGLVYWAEQYVQTGLTSILFGIFPFGVILFSRILLNEKFGIFKLISIILGALGLVVIFAKNIDSNSENSFLGILSLSLSAMIQALNTVVVKKYGKNLNALSMNFIPVLIAGVVFVLTGLIFEDISKNIFDMNAIFSVSYLALLGTLVTFTIYYWLLQRIDIVILSLSSFLEPILAVYLGWLVLSEKLSLTDIIGSALVLIGILFANYRGIKKYIRTKFWDKKEDGKYNKNKKCSFLRLSRSLFRRTSDRWEI